MITARTHRLHPPGFNRISLGHRGYLDAPRLYTVRAHYGVPRPRGHRAFLNIAGAER